LAEKVVVEVQAKDNASAVLRGISKQFGSLGTAIGGLSVASAGWGAIVAAAGTIAVNAIKDTVKATVDYANQVRSLALISGTGAEDASRLLQVMDDFKITADQVKLATRAMTNQGLSPTIETLARLSDEYNQLNPGQERAAFLMKNFGRAGLDLAEAMSKGGDAIRIMGENVQNGLILTEESVRAAREYELALDEWNDSIQALKISIGSELIPALNEEIDRLKIEKLLMDSGTDAATAHAISFKLIRMEADSGTQSYQAWAKAVEQAGSSAEIAATDQKKLLDMQMKLNDATQTQINQMAYQDLYKQLADDADGLTQSEKAALDEIGMQLGIFDQKAVDTAARIEELNQKFIDGTIDINNYSAAIRQIPQYVNTTISTTTIGGAGSGSTGLGADSGFGWGDIP
jgi:hypothetical protein